LDDFKLKVFSIKFRIFTDLPCRSIRLRFDHGPAGPHTINPL
jgi:hypothetical protein